MRRWVAERLERGSWQGPLARGLSGVWAELAEPARPVRLPAGARVLGVGGATLGGSGKTPLVLHLARALAARASGGVAVVSGGHGGRLWRAERVSPLSPVERVGDEALLLARKLDPLPVFAGPRDAALALAAPEARWLLVDGLLQARPERLACSLLTLPPSDQVRRGRCPPAGDLRAPLARLRARCDAQVVVGGEAPLRGALPLFAVGASYVVRDTAGVALAWEELGRMRLGCIRALARPSRIDAVLQTHGLRPIVTQSFADHSRPRPSARTARDLDAWLTSEKCAVKLGPVLHGRPVWSLEQHLELPADLLDFVGAALA